MFKLLQINVDGNTGATGRIADAIGKHAISQGWESYIAHGLLSRASESRIIKIGSIINIYLHGIQTRLFDRHGLGSKKPTIRLIKQIKAIKPDIIHLHNIHGYYVNIEVLFNYLSKSSIPITWTFHDCWSVTGHCCHFDYVGCDKWKTECFKCPQKREYPASYFIDRSRKNFRLKKKLFTTVPDMTIITVSNWLQDILHGSFLRHIPSQVIYNGVDTDIFSPMDSKNKIKERYNIKADFIILGVAGVWTKQKGLGDFIELGNYLNKTYQIILVGMTKSQGKSLPSHIIGVTHTENQHALAEIYSAADIYLNLSVEETFGLTTAEALACGTPAVVYNATACPEIIDTDTGVVVKKNDINEVFNAVETVRRKGKDSYSKACRSRAVEYFNKNERFAEYIDLFEKIIKNKAG